MPAAHPDPALRDAIAAARAGDNLRARDQLLALLQVDERNELAWLWLSAVVDDDADRRVCLENVLAINPANAAARRGLAKLGPPPEAAPSQSADPLDALLVDLPRRDDAATYAPIGYQAESLYADVWESGRALCPYCAALLEEAARRCPACGRDLSRSAYRYPRASSDLLIYWMLLLGVANLYVAQIVVGLLARVPGATAVWQAVIAAWVLVTAAGVFFRRFWAYVASLTTLFLLAAAALLGGLMPVSAEPLDFQSAGLVGLLSAVGAEPYRVVATPLVNLFWRLQIVGMVLAFLYGILRAGPDFDRVEALEAAEPEKGQHDPSRLYALGRAQADVGRWASAALHWRLAAALDPGRAYYQRALGEAYGRLGFYGRALDVLESARRLTVQAAARAEVEALIAWVSEQAATQAAAEGAAADPA